MLYSNYGAPVAQLDRASDFGSEGSGFESWPGRQIRKQLRMSTPALSSEVLFFFGVRGPLSYSIFATSSSRRSYPSFTPVSMPDWIMPSRSSTDW